MPDRLLALFAIVTCLAKAGAENDPIDEPSCDSTKDVSIRYASSSKRLYVEAGSSGKRGGCVTLSDIYAAQEIDGPLYPVDPDSGDRVSSVTGTWLLTESLYVKDGITLNVRSPPLCKYTGIIATIEGHMAGHCKQSIAVSQFVGTNTTLIIG